MTGDNAGSDGPHPSCRLMDKQQLTAEFLANRVRLFSFIYGFIRSTEETEDMVQEVWLRFSDAMDRGIEIEDQAGWCRGTAKNLILHYWRRRRNAKVIVDTELLELVEQAFSEQEADSEFWQVREKALGECIQSLPEKSKRLLRLRYDEGHSFEEMADLVSKSVSSVIMALSRIRRILQRCAQSKLRLSGLAK